MGSKLATLNETPHTRPTAVSSSNGGAVSITTSAVQDGRRRRHDPGMSSQSGSLLMVGNSQRSRTASTSDTSGQPAASADVARSIGSPGTTAIFSGNHSRTGAQRQYSLFGHYWDAFLHSDSSSEDDGDESDGDESSSGSDRRHRSHRRQGRRLTQPSQSNNLVTSSSSTSTSNSAVPFRIPTAPVSSSNALSRASNRRRLRTLIAAHSLPFSLFSASDFKCPICHKSVPSEDIELHVVVCMTKPRIDYNVDVLSEDKGECIICFDEMNNGDTIARLPCLCIYHKKCIDQWFSVRRACPAHPPDDD